MGTRRLTHDTFIHFHPLQAYLSDSLAQGVFPFWDPFSTPGVSTAVSGLYSPISVVIGWLLPYSSGIVVFEIFLFGLIGIAGTYGWLRHQSLPTALSLTGAIAYVGSAPYLTLSSLLSVQFSVALIPWMFWSVDLLTVNLRRNEALIGVFILAISVWFMMTGGYMGVNYMSVLFIGIYGLIRILMTREVALHSIKYTVLAIVLTLALVFLPLTEMLVSFWGQRAALRTMGVSWLPAYDPFLGSIELYGPLNIFFPNGIYVPNMFGHIGRVMYMSVILAVAIPAGMVTVGLKKREAVLLGLAILIILASMGPFSPVATFFVNYVPAFSWFRYHAYNSNMVVLLLIVLSLRLFHRFQIQVHDRPELYRRYIKTALLSFGLVTLAAVAVMIGSQPVKPVQLSWYDITYTSMALVLSSALVAGWISIQNSDPTGRNSHIQINAMSVLLISATVTVVLLIRLTPPELFTPFIRLIYDSQRVENHILRYGLPSMADLLDSKFVSVYSLGMFAMDFVQVGLILGVFVFWICRNRRHSDLLSWGLVVLVFVDLFLASSRYEQGNTYYIHSQLPRDTIQRSETISYPGNNRDPDLTYMSLVDWQPIRTFENYAVQLRRPTFQSFGPFVNPHVMKMMKQPGGVNLFSKLVWLLPQVNDISLETWGQEAIEPDILSQSLQPNSLEVVVNTSRAGRLVWTDSWAKGWRVSVNGAPAVLHRVLGTLKGVDIPPGRSRVIFVYRPVYYKLGMVLFIVGVLGLGVIAGFIYLSNRRGKESNHGS
ncbi:YfhO family protein [Thermodesulfobacteriota bacterium]